MFNTLEEIKAECDRKFVSKPPLMVDESLISATQVPPQRAYSLKMTALPPLDGMNETRILAQLKEEIDKSGFDVKVKSGKVRGHGQHLEIYVKDKRQPLYAMGQKVMFRSDPAGPPKSFRVKSYFWDTVAREYVYHIVSEIDDSGFRTVNEHSLTGS